MAPLVTTLLRAEGQVCNHKRVERIWRRGEAARACPGLARRDGTLTPELAATYGLTASWLSQIGQADLQAASRLQAMAQADTTAATPSRRSPKAWARLALKLRQAVPAASQALGV